MTAEPAASTEPSRATSADKTIAQLIRSQSREISDLGYGITNGNMDATEAQVRFMALEDGVRNMSLVGVSPCMQEVAQSWMPIESKFATLFALRMGADSAAAAAAAEAFSKAGGSPLSPQIEPVTKALDKCLIVTLGGTASSSGESTPASEEDMSKWRATAGEVSMPVFAPTDTMGMSLDTLRTRDDCGAGVEVVSAKYSGPGGAEMNLWESSQQYCGDPGDVSDYGTVSINGDTAYLMASPDFDQPGLLLRWVRDGVRISLEANNEDRSALLRVAESLTQVN